MELNLSERLQLLPPYIFSEINSFKAEAIKQGKKLTSLAIGDPDQPTPLEIIQKIQEASLDPRNHAYSPYEGTLEFRRAVSQWLTRRFGIALDPDRECTALIGSKEGIAHFPHAFCNVGDVCLYPDPGYPIFQTALLLAGAKAVPVKLSARTGFLPDPQDLEKSFVTLRPRMMILNFPSNPTAALISKDLLSEIVDLARRYEVILVFDNAYSEIYFDENKKPISIFEVPGAKDVSIEFHSLSKTFNMTGWRLGFAIGNEKLVQGLVKIKTNVDSGPLMSVQQAACYALEHSTRICDPIRKMYQDRRDLALQKLNKMGVEYLKPEATFYVWVKIPNKEKSMDFCKRLIAKEGIIVTPGIGFGAEGEGFFRLALTVELPELDRALDRLAASL